MVTAGAPSDDTRATGPASHPRQVTPDKSPSSSYDIRMRHAFVHTVIGDHIRVGYAELHDRCPGGDGCEVDVPVDDGLNILSKEALTSPDATGQSL